MGYFTFGFERLLSQSLMIQYTVNFSLPHLHYMILSCFLKLQSYGIMCM